MIKKIIIMLMILMLFQVASAEATNNNQQKAGEELDMPTHSRFVELDNGLVRYENVIREKGMGFSIDNTLITNEGSEYYYDLMGVEWVITEPFVVNSFKSGLDEDVVLDIITKSYNEWDQHTEFNIFGDVSIDTTARKAKYDTRNAVTFSRLDTGIIGVAYTWFYPPDGRIVEADVMFSTRYKWSASGEAGKMDLQNIATHEFGHSAGLLDLYNPTHSEMTMYGYSDYGETKKQTLESGDIAGIQYVYGPFLPN